MGYMEYEAARARNAELRRRAELHRAARTNARQERAPAAATPQRGVLGLRVLLRRSRPA
jgi:hypothetical protein